MTQEEQLTPTQVLYPKGWDDPGVPIAETEWATGIVRYFVPLAESQRLWSADRTTLSESELYRLEVVTHEVTHVLQFVMTGFGYRVSRSMMGAVVRFSSAFPSLTRQYDNLAPYASEVHNVLRELDVTGPAGITARQIMEASAFLIQKRSHYADLTADQFDLMLERQVRNPKYRHAYEIARASLFEDTFHHFAMIANLSLLTSNPSAVFKPLVDLFARSASRFDLVANYDLGWTFLEDQFGDSLLGLAVEQSRGGLIHPVLSGAVERLADLVQSGDLDYRALLGKGIIKTHELAQLLLGPAMYPPGPGEPAAMWLPADWKPPQVGDVTLDPTSLRLMAATSVLLQQVEFTTSD